MIIDIIYLLRHNLMGIPLDVKISDEGKTHYEKYLTGMKEFLPPFSVKSISEHIVWNIGGDFILIVCHFGIRYPTTQFIRINCFCISGIII